MLQGHRDDIKLHLEPDYLFAAGDDDAVGAVGEVLERGLQEHASSWGPRNYLPFFLSLADSSSRAPFGVVGSSSASTFFIDSIWINPSKFSITEASTLGMEMVERIMLEALRRECWTIIAAVFDYDGAVGLGVYAQLGFDPVAVTTGWYGRYTRTLLCKRIKTVS